MVTLTYTTASYSDTTGWTSVSPACFEFFFPGAHAQIAQIGTKP